MKKWIETITAIVMAGFLMVAMVGCGNQVPDQGVVQDAGKDADAEIDEQMNLANEGKEGHEGKQEEYTYRAPQTRREGHEGRYGAMSMGAKAARARAPIRPWRHDIVL